MFVSYAHADDKRYIDELRRFLRVLTRRGLVESWSDHQLTAGVAWEDEILQKLRGADAVICQMSLSFFASDNGMLAELPEALKTQSG